MQGLDAHAYDLPLREQDSYDSDDVTDSPVASPMFGHMHRRRSVDTPPRTGAAAAGAQEGSGQRAYVGTNALDGKYLAPLLIIPWGFGMFAIITEASIGNFPGAAAALWWHIAFWVASAIGNQRPVAALLLSLTALASPLRFEEDIMVRSMHSMAWITHFLRLMTMINEPGYFASRDWKFRVLFVHYYHDIRFASLVDSVNAEVQYMLPSMLMAILMVVVTSYVLRNHIQNPADNEFAEILQIDHRLIRFSRYILAASLFGFSMNLLDALYRLPLVFWLGVTVPSTFRDPHRSRTLAEFWGKRWNLVIRDLLSGGIFKPLVRLSGSPTLARLATFAASGLLHIVPLAVTNQDTIVHSVMFSFFVVMGVLVELEKLLLLKGQLWLVVCFFAVSPLFWEPLLAVLNL